MSMMSMMVVVIHLLVVLVVVSALDAAEVDEKWNSAADKNARNYNNDNKCDTEPSCLLKVITILLCSAEIAHTAEFAVIIVH